MLQYHMLPFSAQKLNGLLDEFKNSGGIENLESYHQERLERRQKFTELLQAPKLTEYEITEIIKLAWSTNIWSNKEWLAQHIIEENGLNKLNRYFKLLTDPNLSITRKYAEFTKNIKGLGPAFTTEILCHLYPSQAAIWNKKSVTLLRYIDAKGANTTKYINAQNFKPKDYEKFNAFLKQLAEYIFKYLGLQNDLNLLDLDYILWQLYELLPAEAKLIRNKGKAATNQKNKTDSSSTKANATSKSYHNELRDKIAQIGQWLGFETQIEKQISAGSRVDVIWQARIANLGSVKYVFEVQHKGSIDSLLVNLLKATNDPTVQKLIIVSDPVQIEQIKKRLADMPENLRKSVKFWPDTQVEQAYENLEQLSEIIRGLGLVE